MTFHTLRAQFAARLGVAVVDPYKRARKVLFEAFGAGLKLRGFGELGAKAVRVSGLRASEGSSTNTHCIDYGYGFVLPA